MHILLAGGAGFVGSHLTDALLKNGHNVLVVDTLERGKLENIQDHIGKKSFSFVKQDIREFSYDGKLDVIVNLVASKIPRYSSGLKTLTLNVEVGRYLLDMAKEKDARYIFISTSDVYGKNKDFPLKEESDLVLGPTISRRWAYAVSKIYNEHLSFAYMDEYKIRVNILRYFGIYGPRQYLNWWGGPIGVFIDAIYNNKEVEIHGDGRQKRSFVFIDDIVDATVQVIEREDINGEIINIASSEEVSILELARLIGNLLERKPKLRFIPYENFSLNYEDPKRRLGSIEKAKRLLSFEPKYTLREGLLKTIKWYKKQMEISNGAKL